MTGVMEFLDIHLLSRSKPYNESMTHILDPDVMIAHKVFVGVALVYCPLITFCSFLVFCGTLMYPGSSMNNQSYLLLSLSAADFLMGSFSIPMYILTYLPHTRETIFKNKYACLTWFASAEMAAGSSIGSLLCISVDRYVAVVFPLHYHTLVTEERCIAVLGLLWTVVIVVAFVPMLGWNTYDPQLYPLTHRCSFYRTLPHNYIVWVSFGSVSFIVLSCALMYAHILSISYRQMKLSERRASLVPAQNRQLKMRIYSVKITSLLVIIFIVLWLPIVFTAPLKYYQLFSPKVFEILQVVSQLFYFSNSLVNAPIYSMLRSEYREVYKVMLLTVPCRWKSILRDLYRTNHASVYYPTEPRLTTASSPVDYSEETLAPEKFQSISEARASKIQILNARNSILKKSVTLISKQNGKESHECGTNGTWV
ncbi:adenosine receptor A2b [Biomphalaria glabrata]|nr:adenosine receptor A2b [Biomphalaria glabrata]